MLTVRNETIENYFLNTDYLCIDDLKLFLKSPKVYFYNKSKNDTDSLDNKETKFKHALNLYLSDRNKFKSDFAICPKYDRRTKQGKLDYSLFLNQNLDKLIIDEIEYEAIKNIRISLDTSEYYSKETTNVLWNVNSSYYVTDEKTGLKLKFRTNYYSVEKSFALNFLVCLNSNIDDLQYFFQKSNMSFENAIVMQELKLKKMTLACCENVAPYQCSFIQFNATTISKSKEDYRMALDLLKWSLDNSFWCNYTQFEVLKKCYKSNKLSVAMSKIKNEILTIR